MSRRSGAEALVLRLPPRELEQRGSCAGHPEPDLFFTDFSGATPALRQVRLICHGCPVRAQCRDYALQVDEPHGVWGGLTPRDREFMMGIRSRPEGRVGAPGRPVVRDHLRCDSCPGAVQLRSLDLHVTSTGARLCDACLRRRGLKSPAKI